MRDVVFIHGWGFDAGVWQSLVPLLSDCRAYYIDMGFTGNCVSDQLPVNDKTIVIGHSLGVMWFLHHKKSDPAALVSIAGFDCFHRHVSSKELKAMQIMLHRDPGALMENFWQRMGVPEKPDKNFNPDKLKDGLEWLAKWDEAEALQGSNCPVLSLAAGKDKIVPAHMAKAIWGNYSIRWAEDANHALPFTHAQWCAKEIQDFVNAL